MNLPERLCPLFHRYDVERLDIQRNANVIIATILQLGTWDDIQWCFQTYGWNRIRDWIADPKASQGVLAPAVQWFWTLVLLGEPRSVPSMGSGNHLREVPVPSWWPDSEPVQPRPP